MRSWTNPMELWSIREVIFTLRIGSIGGSAGSTRGPGSSRRWRGMGPRSIPATGARAVEVGADGPVFILERQGNRLRGVDPDTGVITTRAGTGAKGYSGDGGPAKDATFDGPKEFAIARSGDLLIVDTENHAIRRI